MLTPRQVSQTLRDLIRETGLPGIVSLETGEPLPSGEGLYLWPADNAVLVKGERPSRRDFGSAIHEARNTRHSHRRGRGVSVLYALPGDSDSEWVCGVGTLIGEAHLSRKPSLAAKVVSLGGE
jgi:hypothetical protein